MAEPTLQDKLRQPSYPLTTELVLAAADRIDELEATVARVESVATCLDLLGKNGSADMIRAALDGSPGTGEGRT